jgi:hypothetical protein
MNVILKEEFIKLQGSNVVDVCTLEQYDEGSIYIFGDKLGELIIEFASNAYEKAVSQLAELGYEKVAKDNFANQHAG